MTRLPTATGREVATAVRALVRPYRRLALTSLVLLVAASAVGLLTAPVLGRAVDLVVDGRPASALLLPAAAIAVVALTQGVLAALGETSVARLGESMLARLRERFVDRALRLPLDDVEKAGSGDLTARVTGDIAVVAEAARGALPQLAQSLLTIGLTLVGLAVLDWRFLLAALLAAPIQLHTMRWYVRRAHPVYAAERVAAGALQHRLLDSIGGAATVRAFRLAPSHMDSAAAASTETVRLSLAATRLRTRFYGRLNLAEYIGLSAVLVAGFAMVRSGTVTIGAATAAALYFHNLFNPVNTALALIDDAQAAAAGLARLVGVVDLPAPPEPAAPARPRDASVAVAGVRHEYVPGHPVLHDVDLAVSPAEQVALIGASGAGKTTLVKLIAGIHRPQRGAVLLGGADLAALGTAGTAATVALVSQETHVFAGPLADDLRLARPAATDAALRAALDAVGAGAWARALPDGLATVVGHGGHRLTAAQAQQVALARLLLADRPIVILDEATADAGSADARALEQAVRDALRGRTVLVVAHRLTQAAAADRIVVLDAGRVVETGTHEALTARAGGHYAELWAAYAGPRSAGTGDTG